jgi:hypothetical protein
VNAERKKTQLPAEEGGGIVLPRIGSYADLQRLTGRSYATVTRWTCRRQLRPGIYVGNGMFNLSRIRDCLEKGESFLRVAK